MTNKSNYEGLDGWTHLTPKIGHAQLPEHHFSFHYKSYFDDAPGDPMVLVHGLIGSLNFFSDENFRQLSKLGPVYSISLPGHPPSEFSKPFPKTTPKLFADALACQIRSFANGRKVTLIGHSTGATASLACALYYPDLVQRVVVCEGAPHGRESNGAFRFLQLMVLKGGAIGLALFKATFWLNRTLWGNKLFISDVFAKPSQMYEYEHMWETRAKFFHDLAPLDMDVMKQMFVDLDTLDLRPDLHKIQCPVLVMIGDKDKFIPMEEAKTIADKCPKAKLCVLENCGHAPFFNQPIVWEREITRFVKGE